MNPPLLPVAAAALAPPPPDEAARRRHQTLASRSNLSAEVVSFIVTGPMLALFACDVLHLRPTRIALVQALIPLAALLRFALLPLFDRLGWVRTLVVTAWIRIAAVAVLAVVPAPWLGLPLLILVLAVFSGAREMGFGTVWQPLLRELTTDTDRGRFFARMRLSFQLVSSAVTTAIVLLIGSAISDGGYRLLLVVAALGLLSHWWYIRQIPEPLHEPRPAGAPAGLARWWRVARSSPLLRLPLAVQLLATAAGLPLMVVYLRVMLHLPANLVTLYVLMASVGTVLSLLLWGRIADAIGFRPLLVGMLAIAMAIAPVQLLIAPLPPGSDWSALGGPGVVSAGALLALGLVNGAVDAGVGIAQIAIQHHHADRGSSLEAMGLFSLAKVLSAACCTLFAGWWVEQVAMPAGGTELLGGALHVDWVKAWLVGVGPLLQGAAIACALRLPNARPWFGVADFFTSLTTSPIRSMVAGRNRYHGDDRERTALARWCGEHPNPINLDLLAGLTRDPSLDVRTEAVRALARLRSPAAGEHLLTLLAPEHEHLGDQVCWALGELRHARAAPALIARLDGSRQLLERAQAARALGKIGAAEAVPALVATLADPACPHAVAGACARALLDLGRRDQAPLVLRTLDSLRTRSERYDLLDVLCRWLDISDEWLLRGQPDEYPRQVLRRFAEANGIVPKAPGLLEQIEARDHPALRARFAAALAADPRRAADPVLAALGAWLGEAHGWTAVHVLAAAWLVLAADDGR